MTEFTCSGIVTNGGDSSHDQLILKIASHDDLRIGSPSGVLSAFDGSRPYRICINNEDELTFEYTLGEACGTQATTRYGTLQKAAGTLKLSRVDKDVAFSGVYACRPAH